MTTHTWRLAARRAGQLATWIAIAFLASWAVIVVEQVAPRALVAWTAGLSPDWRVDAFGVRALPLAGPTPGDVAGRDVRTLQWAASVAAGLLFVLAAGRSWRRTNAPADAGVFRRVALVAGLWIVAHRVPDFVRLSLRGGGPVRGLAAALPDPWQGAFATVAPLALAGLCLWLGVQVVAALIPLLWPGRDKTRSHEIAALLGLVTFMAGLGPVGSGRYRFWSLDDGLWNVGGPLLAAAALWAVAVARARVAHPPVAGLPTRRSFLAVATALALAVALARVDGVRASRVESQLAHVETAHYEVRYSPASWSLDEATRFAQAREARFAQFASRLPPPQGPRLRVIVYADARARRLATRGFATVQATGSTVRISADDAAPTVLDTTVDARLFLTHVWGVSESPVVTAWATRWLVGGWAGQPLAAWAARLARDGGAQAEIGALTALVDGVTTRERPPSEGEALGAAWLDLVAGRYGTDAVERLYRGAPARASLADFASLLGDAAPGLEADWNAWLATLADTPLPMPAALVGADRLPPVSFAHGITLKATELPPAVVRAALERLVALGVDAVALTTHEHVRDGDRIEYHTTTGESDQRLLRAVRDARRLGMRVLLKPHLYLGDAGFAGDLCIADGRSRARFMTSYLRLMLHYARMAQDEGVELFSVGNELSCLTGHEHDWRRLIAHVRRVYAGPVTYASNWGEEFERLPFGDALDYLGVNHYYPLTAARTEALPEMMLRAAAVARSLEAVHVRWQRPVLFTEVGYPSVDGGTTTPWAPPTRTPDPAEQAAAYEAVFRVYEGLPWLHGYYWWAWLDGDFSPAGKPAEQVLRAWYARADE